MQPWPRLLRKQTDPQLDGVGRPRHDERVLPPHVGVLLVQNRRRRPAAGARLHDAPPRTSPRAKSVPALHRVGRPQEPPQMDALPRGVAAGLGRREAATKKHHRGGAAGAGGEDKTALQMLQSVGPCQHPPPPPGEHHCRRPSYPVRRGGAATGVLGIHVSHGGVRAAPRATRVRLRDGGRRRRRIARGVPRGQPARGLAQYYDDGAGTHRWANGGGRAVVRARGGAVPGGPGAGQPAVFGAAVYEV